MDNSKTILNSDSGSNTNENNTETNEKCGFNLENVKEIRDKLIYLNEIRSELIKLNINLETKIFNDNEVFPLLNDLYLLSYVAGNISISANNIALTNLGKHSKVKEALDLVYEVNESADELFHVIKGKLKELECIAKK